nr:hypothetical protein Iba_chr02fCG1650 [Ipomoea batatas]
MTADDPHHTVPRNRCMIPHKCRRLEQNQQSALQPSVVRQHGEDAQNSESDALCNLVVLRIISVWNATNMCGISRKKRNLNRKPLDSPGQAPSKRVFDFVNLLGEKRRKTTAAGDTNAVHIPSGQSGARYLQIHQASGAPFPSTRSGTQHQSSHLFG